MTILRGWKEIADCLHMTSRTARRWERLGLPVRRVSDTNRSPIVAFPNEIEDWVRERKMREAQPRQLSVDIFAVRRQETLRLLQDMRASRLEQSSLLDAVRRLRATNKEKEMRLDAIRERIDKSRKLLAHLSVYRQSYSPGSEFAGSMGRHRPLAGTRYTG
jgi:hypothetical protein